MRGLGSFLNNIWFLATPYFRSKEKASAWALLVIVLVLNFVLVGLHVVLNNWSGAFFESFQGKDSVAFFQLLLTWRYSPDGYWGVIPGFVGLAFVLIVLSIIRSYLRQWLQIRWRRWMTERFQDNWLTGRAYYVLALQADRADAGTDNPDQRISDDVNNFVDSALVLGLELISKVASVISFLTILWGLSGSVTLFGVTIPGYMVWVALIYAVVGTLLTNLVGRPLVGLNFAKQRLEADFRFALVRMRENAEGIALYAGEADEGRNLTARFAGIVVNWYAIMMRNLKLSALIAGYEQVAIIFPFVVAAPRYFSGALNFGQVNRIAGAFATVQGGLSWIVDRYSDLAEWTATANRLATFQRTLDAIHLAEGKGIVMAPATDGAVSSAGLRLTLPDGSALLDAAGLRLAPNEATVITGPSGTGKSTLFRALAGIWPFGSGTLQRPRGSALFLPQKPYIPLGTLRRAVSYPAAADYYPEAQVAAALTDAGLGRLVPELDRDEPWTQRLSGGEQQRLALARALLARPDWLFMDEATASMDPEGELDLYRMVRERLPGTTLVSISHRPEVTALHGRQINLRRGPGGSALEAEPIAAE